MTTYADKSTLLRALTQLHEQTVDEPLTRTIFGGAVLVREITARQRQNANDAALADNPDQPDNALYRAMLIQQAVVDPESGTPYADGRRGPDGEALIDPRTRTPLFTVNEVLLLADGRDIPVEELTKRITSLAALGPHAMFSGDTAADTRERNEGTGAETAENPIGTDTHEGVSDSDGGAAHASVTLAPDGDTAESAAG